MNSKDTKVFGYIVLGIILAFVITVFALMPENDEQPTKKNASNTITETTAVVETKSFDWYKENVKEYDYNTLARNPEKLKGTNVLIKVKVGFIEEYDNSTEMAVYMIDEDKLYRKYLYVSYPFNNKGDNRILEDDILYVYGTYDGLATTDIFYDDKGDSFPLVKADYIQLTNEKDD